MRVSIAMCTYNGERFLEEQLQSIFSQSHQIDELIVCDDGSKDKTISILQQFKQKVPFLVKIHINQINLGSSKNFEQCIMMCNGDIILFCDQDDIWMGERVVKTIQYFASNPSQLAVFSNASVIDEDSQFLNTTAWNEVQFTSEKQHQWRSDGSFFVLINGYIVTGATLAIRKEAISEILPIPNLYKELIHDGWIALWLSLKNQIGFMDESLIYYRQYSSQQVGFGGNRTYITFKNRFTRPRAEKLEPIRKRYYEAEQLFNYLKNKPEVPKDKLQLLETRKNHYKFRSNLSENRFSRILPILRNVDNYKQFESKQWWNPFFGDMFE